MYTFSLRPLKPLLGGVKKNVNGGLTMFLHLDTVGVFRLENKDMNTHSVTTTFWYWRWQEKAVCPLLYGFML